MCNASSQVQSINSGIQQFSKQLSAQASSVFGNDSTVFNTLMGAYGGMVANGPNQQGWSAAEVSAVNSGIVTAAAQQSRNAMAAVKNAASAVGGGNTPTNAGVTTAAETGVATAMAANEANQLNQATQANYKQGRENFFAGAEGMSKAPGVFTNMGELDKNALQGQQNAMQSQQGVDAQNNWWQKPVMGLVTGAADAMTGGLTGDLGTAMSKVGSGNWGW